MKSNLLTATLLSLAALAVGCDKKDTTSQQINAVEAKTDEAAQEMKDYSYAQKAEFTETMQGQLAAINKDMDRLSARIEQSSDAAKAEAKPKLQALREKADRLGKQLEEAKGATESTWDSVKAGSKKTYGELKDGFTQARHWLSDKIAP